ncbi:50S ribosomal protein L22 [Candidatus Curtissbacteria bacterium]|nr:50S ribosomal protein L22 [Candidatus Curtissbacteria bacterium]
MQVTATAKNIRISPKKVRLVVSQIKKMNPQQAIEILAFTRKSSAKPIGKVIASAIANAKNNFGLNQTNLRFKSILVGIGPVAKRYRPISRGRPHSILKRTSHIKVILEGEQPKKETKITKEPEEPKEKSE